MGQRIDMDRLPQLKVETGQGNAIGLSIERPAPVSSTPRTDRAFGILPATIENEETPYQCSSKLERDLDAHKRIFRELCDEWKESCEPGCDSLGHDEKCGGVFITQALRQRRERAEAAERELAEWRKPVEDVDAMLETVIGPVEWLERYGKWVSIARRLATQLRAKEKECEELRKGKAE